MPSTKIPVLFVIIVKIVTIFILTSCDFSEEGIRFGKNKNSFHNMSGHNELVAKEIFEVLHSSPQSAREMATNILDTLSPDNKFLEIEILKHIGTSYSMEGVFHEALNKYSEALSRAQSINSTLQIADINNNIALVNRSVGNFKNAFIHFTEAVNYYEELGDENGKANAFNNIGLLHRDLDNTEKAEQYLHKALDGFTHGNDTIGISIALNNLSLIYASYEDYDKAFAYLDRSIELAESINNIYSLCISYQALGNIHFSLHELDDALSAFIKSADIAKKSNQPFQLASARLGEAKVHMRNNDYDEALRITEGVMEVSKELKSLIVENMTHNVLYKVYKSIGDYESSLVHYTDYNNSKEKLLNQTIIQQIYDFEISNLSQANKLQELELERKELSIRNKNLLLGFTIFISLLTITGLYFFYRSRQRLKLQQTIIELTEKKSHAAVEAEIQERKRIGQELHDGLGQMLSVAGLNISVLQKKKELSETRKNKLLETAMQSLDEAFAEVRNISHNMAPSLLSERGLSGALKSLADKVNQSKQLKMKFETFGLNGKLNSLVENTLYRSIQEILNNAIKHSAATELSFQIIQGSNEISLMAEDNGKGFDQKIINFERGSGLLHMQSRIENLNGNIHIDSNPMRGTIISIVIPLNPSNNVKRAYQSIGG